jgi:Na+/H+ antiporter NhaA
MYLCMLNSTHYVYRYCTFGVSGIAMYKSFLLWGNGGLMSTFYLGMVEKWLVKRSLCSNVQGLHNFIAKRQLLPGFAKLAHACLVA